MMAKMATTAGLERVEAQLRRANGRRRERLLGMEDVRTVARYVSADGKPCAWMDGGTVANAYKQPALTTLILAARIGGQVFLGITSAPAKATSPGRAWKALQPWSAKGPSVAKLEAWAGDGDVIRLTPEEVAALDPDPEED
jgi:hypothetical protein